MEVTIRKPLDAHQHFRDGSMLTEIAPYVSDRCFAAIAMPNLKPPITTIERVREYREEILSATGPNFQPLMTFYFLY